MDTFCLSITLIVIAVLILLIYSLCRMAAKGDAMNEAFRRKEGSN